MAQYLGSEDNCPRFKIIENAMYQELGDVGIKEDKDFKSEEFNSERVTALMAVIASFESNPTSMCASAWMQFGPNGSYRRQLLEAQ